MLLKVLPSIIGFFLTKGQILPRVREAFSISVFYIMALIGSKSSRFHLSQGDGEELVLQHLCYVMSVRTRLFCNKAAVGQ